MPIEGYAALAPKGPLVPFTYEEPPLAPHEILIQVSHCGLCHTDLYMIDNAWQRSHYPLVAGHEIIGTVVKKGAQATLPLGCRVGAGWINASCLHCRECLAGHTNICPTKTAIYSQGRFGGFATHVVCDSRFAFPIPPSIDSAHAAPLLCAGATVYAPLARYPAQTIGVIGIGGLGHLALQYARAMGREVSALSSTPDKEKEAKHFGAAHFYTPEKPPLPMQFDFLLCTTDAPLNWNQILTYLRPNGILCFVSRPPAGIQIDPAHFVSSQRSIVGSNNASLEVMHQMLRFSAKHNIVPQIEQMPIAKINKALAKVRSNQARYRIVLSI